MLYTDRFYSPRASQQFEIHWHALIEAIIHSLLVTSLLLSLMTPLWDPSLASLPVFDATDLANRQVEDWAQWMTPGLPFPAVTVPHASMSPNREHASAGRKEHSSAALPNNGAIAAENVNRGAGAPPQVEPAADAARGQESINSFLVPQQSSALPTGQTGELLPDWFSVNAPTGYQETLDQQLVADLPLLPNLSTSELAADATDSPAALTLGTAFAPAWFAPATNDRTPNQETARSRSLPFAPLAFPGVGACLPVTDTATSITPPLIVRQGRLNGELFTVQITNNTTTTESIPEISLQTEPAAGFYFIGNSATATSNIDGNLPLNQPAVNSPPGQPFTIFLDGTVAEYSLAPGETVTMSYRLATDFTAQSGELLTATWQSGDTPDPVACIAASVPVETALCPRPSELDRTLTLPPERVSFGNFAGDVYTYTVTNNSVYTSNSVSFVVDPAPGFFFKGGSATLYNSGGTLPVTQPAIDIAPSATFTITPQSAYDLGPGQSLTLTFRLGTNDEAVSGQQLAVNFRSGAEPTVVCDTMVENVPTGRGNLVIQKTESPQFAAIGDVVTWTVTARNSGLGNIYAPTVTDVPGSGVALLSVDPPFASIPTVIEPEESVTYTVVGQVNACVDLNNRADATWSIGNADGSATVGNPVSARADLVYSYEDPNIVVAVEPLDVDYCGILDTERQVTVTNAGGAVDNFRLNFATSSGFSVANLDTANWDTVGNSFVYTGSTGTLPAGTMGNGQTLTFTMRVTSASAICAADNGDITLTPVYNEACAPGDNLQGTPTVTSIDSGNAPTLSLEKSASTTNAVTGDTVFYTLTVAGRNPDNVLAVGLRITDALPSALTNIQYSTSVTPTPTALGGSFLDINMPVANGNYSAEVYISGEIPTGGACGVGLYVNNARASSTFCPECNLAFADAEMLNVTLPPSGAGNGNSFVMQSDTVELCGDSLQTQTAIISITNGITWTGTTYADDLVAENGVGPLFPSNIQLFVDGIDRTADVTVTTSTTTTPRLQIALDDIGTYSNTAAITITYNVTAAVNATPGQGMYFSYFTAGGFDDVPACGYTAVALNEITLERASLGRLALDPATLQSCRVNDVTLTVDGDNMDVTIADHMVLTFTAAASDIMTPTDFVLGGSLSTLPTTSVTVTQNSNVVTFTLPPTLDLDSPGTITFPLYRPCGTDEQLQAGIGYIDACEVPRSHSANGGLSTLASNLILLTPDITYTVNTTATPWLFSVRNIGNLAATDAVITMTLPEGHHFDPDAFIVSNVPQPIIDAISTTTTTVGGHEILNILIPEAPANSRIQFDGRSDVTQMCNAEGEQLLIELTEPCGQVGGTCAARQRDAWGYEPGVISLLSSNTQSGILPLCSEGEVILTVKNSSAEADSFNFIITETVRGAGYVPGSATVTVTDKQGQTLVANEPFTPTAIITVSNAPREIQLLWEFDQLASYPAAVRDVLTQRRGSDTINITFRARASCQDEETTARSTIVASNICGTETSLFESATTLVVGRPTLAMDKQVRNTTLDSDTAKNTFAAVGDQLVYQIDIANSGEVGASYLDIEDTVPDWFEIESTSIPTTSQSGQVLHWGLSGTPYLAADDTLQLLITGTVGTLACSGDNINRVIVQSGCDAGDICTTEALSAEATIESRPALQVTAPNVTLNQCGPGPLEVTFANNGARAENVVITYTLPAGMTYVGVATGSDPQPDATPAAGASGVITFGYAIIDSLVTTNTLRFSVTADSAVCTADGAGSADIRYTDSCGTAYDDVTVDNLSLTVQNSALAAALPTNWLLAPHTRVVQSDQEYSWDFSFRNDGSGAASNVVITHTLGSGYTGVTAGMLSSGGATYTPTVNGNTITWTVPSLPAGDRLDATITATVHSIPVDLQITSTVHSACDSGGCVELLSDNTFATALEFFDKAAEPTELTIGDLTVFTVTAELFGNYVYTDVILTDTLPTGLGYRAGQLTLITDSDGDTGGPTTTVLAPTAAPALNADNSAIRWAIGTITGQITMTAVVTAVVLDRATSGSNANYDGRERNNQATLTYRDDGQAYTHNDSQSVSIREPLLHIGQSYMTAAMCPATLFTDNFNDGDSAGWATTGSGWTINANRFQQNANAGNRLALAGNSSWQNYAYSALFHSTDTDGQLGLIFRAQDTSNYYRFVWDRGSTDNYRIERVEAGSATTLGSAAGGRYETQRTYHVEIQTIDNRFLVYIDGALALDRTDATNALPTGRIGLYAPNQNAVLFDDILVTKLDDAGCFVAAGEQITYTLTISNQQAAMGHDLVITDLIPAGTSLVTYSVQSDDPATIVTPTVGTVPGATGRLIWNVNQLAARTPFAANDHTVLEFTVVLSVSNLISAAAKLTSQASLSYDSQAGNGPAAIERSYSGGSHATTVQTVAPVAILKSGTPLTATIGEYIFYTITVPTPTITATLHNVTVTDQLPANLALVGSPVISGGVNSADLSNTDGLTVTFERIDPTLRASIAFTTVVRNSALNQAGVDVVNRARLAWQNGAGEAEPPLISNAITTTLIEPVLTIDKQAHNVSAVKAGDIVTYSLRIAHAPTSNATAHNLTIIDNIPDNFTYQSGSLQVVPSPAISVTNEQLIRAEFDALGTLSTTIAITYAVTVDAATEPSSALTNTANISYTSLPDRPDEERTGSGIGPNDYTATAAASVTTDDSIISKSLLDDRDYTIGEAITYTIAVTVPTGLTRLRPRITDTIPAGLRYDPAASFLSLTTEPAFTLPSYSIIQDPAAGGDGALTSTVSLAFDDVISNTTGGPAVILWTFRLIVANSATANHGETKPNNAHFVYLNANDNVERHDTAPVTIDLVEPHLIVEKSVSPTSLTPGDVAFYQIQIYHSPTSTVPAHTVAVTDVLPAGLNYISDSWDQTLGVLATTLNDDNNPILTASWAEIPTTTTASNPIRLRYNVVVPPDAIPGQLFTNTVTTTWQSLANDPYGDRRNSSGGVNDYRNAASAALALSEVSIDKNGPLTITAGSLITYALTVFNSGPYTAVQTTVTDTMPFQVDTLAATYAVSDVTGSCSFVALSTGDRVYCDLGDVPVGVSGRIVITGRVDANTPLATDLTNSAQFTTISPDGDVSNNSKTFETEVETAADVAVAKRGPLTATAGSLISYTIVLTNSGPSVARDVDLKDLLPPGLSYVDGSSTQGSCVSAICQLGDVAVGDAITMVVTATVNSDATGIALNTARYFGDTRDPNAANDSATVSTTIGQQSRLLIAKTDLADPVYAGDRYFYEIVITNTGPSQANNLIFTDTLPSQVTYAGASPECTAANGASDTVTCALGTLDAGETRDLLIHVTLSDTVISGTIGTNVVVLTTTTPVADDSVLSATATTTYLQQSGEPTDLILDKATSVATLNAGNGVVTYTLTVTNAGPAPASAVQVVDALPPEFDFVSAVTSRDQSVALCNGGIVCDLGMLAVDETVAITVVATVPAAVDAGTYTNTAHVSSPAQELDRRNNTSSATVEIDAPATLIIAQSAAPSPATPGEELAYTIIVTNSGPALARGVTVSNTLPAGYNLDTVLSTRGSCTVNGNLLSCTLGDLAVDDPVTIALNGTLAADGFIATGTGATPVVTVTQAITNRVTAVATNTTVTATAQISTPLQPRADLFVSVDGPVNAAPGDTIRYTVTVENLGPSAAPHLYLTDTLPSDVTFVALAAPANSMCGATGNTITCTRAGLAVGARFILPISVTVNSDSALGQNIENSVTVSTDAVDPVQSNNRATVDTAIGGSSDLVLTMRQVAPVGAVTVGQLVTYTLTITNQGPAIAENVVVREVPPAGLQLVQMTSSSGTCRGDSCLLGTLAVSATQTITVIARVSPQTTDATLINSAIATSDNESNYGNNVADTSTIVTQLAELVITKRADPVVAVANADLTYELIVTNRGPSAAADLIISDTLPSGFTVAAISSDPASCITLPCTIEQLNADATIRVQIQGTVAPTVTAPLVNRAAVTSSTPLTNVVATATTITTAVTTQADLALQKTATANVYTGGTITYTLTVINNGGSAATAVVVTDTLPTEVRFQGASTGCQPDGGIITCSLGTLATGAARVVTVTVNAADDLSAGTAVVNRAAVGAATADPVTSNNSAEATTLVAVSADLTVAQSGATSVVAGEAITYTIVLTNRGPGTPHWLDIKDALPTGVSAQQVTAMRSDGGTVACAGAICQAADFAAGTVMTMTVVGQVDPALAAGTMLSNTITLFSDAHDPTTDDHTATIVTAVTAQADLTVDKVALADSVAPTDGLLYEINVFNNGPSTASNLIVSDTLDSNVTFAGATDGCELVGNIVSCLVDRVPPASSATFLLAVTVDDVVSGTLLTNRVAVTSSTPLINRADDSDVVTTTVQQAFGPSTDLGLTMAGNPGTVIAGEKVTYTLVVSNAGPQQATNVQLFDLLPTGMTLLATAATNPADGNALCTLGGSCQLGSLDVGSVATVTLVAQVSADLAPTQLQNNAIVAADQRDRAPANNIATATTSVTAAADLVLAKRALSERATAGGTLLYQLAVTNNGPSTATQIRLTDTLSTGLTYLGASPGCLAAGNQISCEQTRLAVGATATFLIQTAVADTLVAGTWLTNTAVVTSNVSDPVAANNQALTSTPVEQSALNPTDLAIGKSATPDPVIAGETLTYTLTITNLGPTTATNVMVVDALPAAVTAETVASSQGFCTLNGLCDLGEVAGGESATVTLVASVAPETTTAIYNEANVTAANADPVQGNNRAGVSTVVSTTADLQITKSVDPPTATPGERLRYQIIVTNSGPSVAENIVVSDTLPAALNNVRFRSSQGSCNDGGLCLIETLAPAARVIIDVEGIVASNVLTAVVNRVAVTSATIDPDPANNSAVATAPYAPRADLALALDSTSTADAGTALTVTATLYNLGPSDATGTVVTVTLPPSTTFTAATLPTGWSATANGNGTVTLSTTNVLAAGTQVMLPITVATASTVVPGSSLAFRATTTSTIDDPSVQNNSATSDSSIIDRADLHLVTTGPLTITAGTIITFTTRVTNNGPSAARAVDIQDQLPAGLTVQQSTLARATNANALCSGTFCQVGPMMVGEVVTMTIVALVDSTLAAGTTLTNRATLFTVSTDPVATNNSDTHTTVVTTTADLLVAKEARPTTAVPGEELTYLITVDNRGPSAASDVLISDTLPAGFTATSISSNQSDCSTLPCAVETLASDEEVTVTIIGTVASTVTTALVNRAAVSAATGDPSTVDNTITLTTAVAPAADLALALQATPTSAGGEQMTVTATVFNRGPSHAAGAVVTITLAPSTTFASATLPVGWSATVVNEGAGNRFVTITTTQTVTPATPVPLSLALTIDPAVAPGSSLEFAAAVDATTPDPDRSNNQATADGTVLATGDLEISKIQRTPNPIVAGEMVTYTITITNRGPSAARAVDIKDELPTGMTLHQIQASDGGICGGAVCQFGSVAVNATRTVTVVARVASIAAAGVYTNNAGVFSLDDPTSANNSAQVTTTVTTASDLTLHKVALDATVAPLGTLLYELTLFNHGPSAAAAVTITDTLDNNATFAAAPTACVHTGAAADGTGGTVVCTADSLLPNQRASYLVAVQAGDRISGTIITNQATVGSSTPLINPLDDSTTVTTTITQDFGATADLEISKVGTPATVVAGEAVTYTLVVSNAGPQSATNVELLDLIPVGSKVSAITVEQPADATAQCGLSGNCLLGTLAPATTATVTLVLAVAADFAGATIVNSASVRADQRDPNGSNNLATATNNVVMLADLSIGKQALATAISAGELLLYQVVITNSGPSLAVAPVFTDTLPTGVSFVGGSPGCTHASGTVRCALASLAPNATATRLIQVRVAESLPQNTRLINQVAVAGTTPDNDQSNNSATAETLVTQRALNATDVALEKRAIPATVTAGTGITYTLTVSNLGPTIATDVVLIDALPSALQVVSIETSQGLCTNAGFCSLGNVPITETAVVTIVGTVDNEATGSLFNEARVTAANPDPDPANNRATIATPLNTVADLHISKVAEPLTATPGSTLRYQIIVTSTGPSAAQNVVVSDTLPASLTNVRFSTSQGSCDGQGLCALGTFQPGTTVVINVVGAVPTAAIGAIVNRASVTSTTPDPAPISNRAVVTSPLVAMADLHLDLASTATVNGGETVTVTATVLNRGPSHASGTVVAITLPPKTRFTSALLPSGWAAVENGNGTVTLTTTATLPPGVGVDLALLVTVDNDIEPGSSIDFSAVVTATTSDPDLTDNRATSDSSIIALADLVLTQHGPTIITAGLPATYTFIVTNDGPSVAHFVDIKAQLPTGLSLRQSAISRSGQGTQACAGAICQLGDMAVDEVARMLVVADVDADLPVGTQVSNKGAVFAVTADPNEANNSDSYSSTVQVAADLAITKRAVPAPAVPGAEVTYLIEVTNLGPSVATAVVVDDLLPTGFTLITMTSTLGGCATMPCTLGTVPSGESAAITLMGLVASERILALVNRASVSSSTPDPVPANSSTAITTALSPQANLALTIDSPPTVDGGSPATVTVTLRNQGPSNAVGHVVTVTLPPSTSFDSALLPTGWAAVDNGNGTVTLNSSDPLLPEQSVTLPVVVAVDNGIEPGSSIDFSGVVTATTPDPDPANNRTTSDTSIVALADLVLTKAGPAVVTAGLPATYTVIVTNNGPSVAHFVDIKDQLPTGLSLRQATISRMGQGVQACAGAICQLGDMAVGEVARMTVVAELAADRPAGARVINRAAAFAVTADPNAANNSDSQISTVQAYAQLHIEKRDLVDPVAPGALLMYMIEVVNDGPSIARNVNITESLPAGVTYMSSTGSCMEMAAGLLRCGIGLLEAKAATQFQVIVRVDSTLVNGTTITNNVQLSSDTTLSSESNLVASETTVVEEFLGSPADLILDKRTSSPLVAAGGNITYTLVVTNLGPASATDVKLIDVLPSGLTLLGVESSQGLCNPSVDCLLGTLPYAGTPTASTVQIYATVNRDVGEGDLLLNRALVQANQPDPNKSNNVAEITVYNQSTADLSITKSASSNPVAAGEPIRYTIIVTNAGPADAVNVRITDTLPAALVNVLANSTRGSCQINGSCQIARLPAGAAATIELYGTVAAAASGQLENRVIVRSDTPDPTSLNNGDEVVTELVNRSDLAVLVGSTPTIQAGRQATATVTVYNYGPSVAPGTVVQITIPPGVTLDETTFPPGWTLVENRNGVLTVVAADAVPPRVPIDLSMVVTFDSELEVGSSHQFDAVISGDIADPDPLNNQDDADTSIVGIADLLVRKQTNTEIVEAGDTVIYTITVTNQGPSLASNVDVKELLPPELALLQLSASQGACVSRICQLGMLPVSKTATITVVTQVAPDTPLGSPVNNKAAVFSGSMDPFVVNNEATKDITVGPVADLMISKRTNMTFAQPGTLVPFMIEVVNRGPSIAPAVVFTDTLPVSFEYLQTDNRCRATTRFIIVCSVGTLAVDEVAYLTIFATIQPDVAHGWQHNHVDVGSDELYDPTPANNVNEASIQALNAPTVVDQLTFLGRAGKDRVQLQWLVPATDATVAFHLRRAPAENPDQQSRITAAPIPATAAQSGTTYEYVDGDVQSARAYLYWLEAIQADGSTTLYGPKTVVVPERTHEIFLPMIRRD